MRGKRVAFVVAAFFACAQVPFAPSALAGPHDALIAKHAAANGLPESLVRRVIRIESRGNAHAVYAGNYGLMQIRLATARGVGYSGDAQGLLDAETNLTYAVKYLAGAYRAAGCDADRAVLLYQQGYYGAAQRECAGSPSNVVQVAQTDAKTDGKGKREKGAAKPKADGAASKSADVIKPKVVRIETISSKTATPLVRPLGKFDPVRMAPPPAPQQATSTNPAPGAADAVKPAQANASPTTPASTPKADRLNAKAEPAGKFELASVPLPPVRPSFDAAAPAKQSVKPSRHSERRHEHVDKKKDEQNPVLAAAGESTNAVVSVLKKLVTPEKKPRRHHRVEADDDPPSHVQPPQ
jgi:hypothetical protein